VRSLRELNRNKRNSFSAEDAFVHPLTEKIEFCCNRLNGMQHEFIELLKKTNGERVEWVAHESSSLTRRELQLDTNQKNLAKFQRDVQQALESLQLEKSELRAVQERIRSQEKISRTEFLSCQQSLRSERQQLLEEKLRLQERENKWLEEKHKQETMLESKRAEINESFQAATLTRERADKELFKAKTELAVIQDQKRKLQFDMETFNEERGIFKRERSQFEIDSVDMKKKYEEAKHILKESDSRKGKLEQLEESILKENELLRVRRQRLETERETFEREMVDVLRRESSPSMAWTSGANVEHSDRVRRLPRGTGPLPTFSLSCTHGANSSFDLDAELQSLRATTAQTKRFLSSVKLTR